MRIDVLTLFPGIFQGYLAESLVRKACDKSILGIHLWNWRDWAAEPHHSVDDRPYGGGPGMVLLCDPLFRAVEAVQAQDQQLTLRLVRLVHQVKAMLVGRDYLLLISPVAVAVALVL